MTKRCIHKVSTGNVACDQEVVYLTAEQAQERGWRYSGWYHKTYVQGHHAVPDTYR